jgi:hypothetical protein
MAAAMLPVSELESPKLNTTGRAPGRQLNPFAVTASASARSAAPAADIAVLGRLTSVQRHVTCCAEHSR